VRRQRSWRQRRRAHAQVAIKAFEVGYGAKYPKAVAKIVDDTVRLRTKATKGPGHARPETLPHRIS
jgi:hypothetical protein